MSDRRQQARRGLEIPPVEPLSDLSWLRVERAVFAELDAARAAAPPVPARRSHRWMFALAAPLAAAAAVVLWLVIPSAPAPHERPARLATADSKTEVVFGDSVITAEAHSTLVMGGSSDGGVLIVLERGGATFEVSPRQHRPAFRVEAGDVSVRVVGTRFSVSRSGDAASVHVLEGTVEVVARGRRVLVHAGDSWSSSGDREAAARDSASSGAAAAPSEPPLAVPAVMVPAPPAPSETRTKPRKERAPAVEAPEPEPEEVDDDLSGPRGPTTKEQFEEAARLERSDPEQALRSYRTLARGTGPWAANALYAEARLSFDRGDQRRAKKRLAEYLRRFPGGANAADARALLDRM